MKLSHQNALRAKMHGISGSIESKVERDVKGQELVMKK